MLSYAYEMQISGAQLQTLGFQSRQFLIPTRVLTCEKKPEMLHQPTVTEVSVSRWKMKTDACYFRISGPMTGALTTYAFTFMRYSLAVTPKNYLLFACHFLNAGAQLTQGYRWTQYHYGKDSKKNVGEDLGTTT